MTKINQKYSDAVPSASPTAAAALVLQTGACALYEVNAVAGASAGFVMVFDAVSAPADGTVTPKRVWPIPANGSLEYIFHLPLQFMLGCVLVFSTTGPFTKTASATAFLGGAVQ